MPREEDFDRLGRELLVALRDHPDEFGPAVSMPAPGAALEGRIPDFVLESETGLLLGEAPAQSLSLALPVFEPGAMREAVWSVGPSLAEAARAGAPRDFLQILVVEAPAPASRALLARLGSVRSLARRLPGWFAHSVDAQTSVRVHRELIAAGLAQADLARALQAGLRAEGFSGAAAIAVGLPSPSALALLRPFAERVRRLKDALAVGASGKASPEGCEGKDCRTCDERGVCDKVREVLAAARQDRGDP
jgi:hypothetical protein